MVNADIVLLFGVECFAAGRFGNFNMLRMTNPFCGIEPPMAIVREIKKNGYQ
jgi:hypothetical protein